MSKRRRLNETHPDNDFYDGLDPQIPQRNFVEFRDGLRDHSDRDDEAIEARDDEVNARERDAELLDALQANMRNALTEEERLVVDLRIQMRATYAAIAARVGLSGPSQARKIEQRALQKMRKRLSKALLPSPVGVSVSATFTKANCRSASMGLSSGDGTLRNSSFSISRYLKCRILAMPPSGTARPPTL